MGAMKVYVLTHFVEIGQPGYYNFVSAYSSEEAARTAAETFFASWPEKDRMVWRDGRWHDDGLSWQPYYGPTLVTPGHRGLRQSVRVGDDMQDVLYVIFECEV